MKKRYKYKQERQLFLLVKHLTKSHRNFLRSLLPEEDADYVLAKVDEYLKQGPKAAPRLRRLLWQYRQVRERLSGPLYDKKYEGYSPLPGYPNVPSLEYACPCRGCKYTRRFSQAPNSPPLCPNHRVALVPLVEKGPGRKCS